jgi:tRNA (cmo5U34)-methyltransferase
MLPKHAAIIDVGAGTGNLSLRMLKQCDSCSVTLLDFSENMLNAVPEVLKDYSGRYTTVCADFATAEFPPQSFDAIISSFAIHHSRGIDEYAALYSKFKTWLKPGGMFACLDVVSGSTAHWTAINIKGWRGYLEQHFDAETIEHIIANHHVEDSPIALPEHCECLLRVAGFKYVDVLWKRYNFALYCAQL